MKRLLTLLIFLFAGLLAYSQDQTSTPVSAPQKKKVNVYLKDGTKLVGTFDRLSSDTLYFNHDVLGYQKIPQDKIEKFTFADDDNDLGDFVQAETESFFRKYGFGNLNHGRYAMSANAFAPEKGEGYYTNYMLYLNNSFAYGLTDHLAMNFGLVTIIPNISLKYHTAVGPRSSIGITGGMMFIPEFMTGDGSSTSGLSPSPYGIAGYSIGDRAKNVSLGVGAIVVNGFAYPFFSAGANADLSTSFSITFEMPYLGRGVRGLNSDLFIPMIMPKLYTKRSMWGLGITYPLAYDRVTETWALPPVPIPAFVYSVRFGPVGPER